VREGNILETRSIKFHSKTEDLQNKKAPQRVEEKALLHEQGEIDEGHIV